MTDVTSLERGMRASDSSGDHEVANLAGRQHGVVAHTQLRALGLDRCAIQRRVSAGRLHRKHRGLVVHTVRQLYDDDRALVENIPVTSVSRTLLDLADACPNRLDRALEEAERLEVFDLSELEALIDHSHGRRGLRALKAALNTYRDRPFTRSELERMLSDLCRAADLPTPAFNVWIAGHEVDAVWPRERLVVELDGYEFHRTRAAFEHDRRRDADLQLAGYRTVRFTYRQLEDEPAEVIRVLRMLLAVTPRVRVP